MANTLKFGNGEWYGKKDTILAYNDENSNYKPLPFNFSRASKATVINKDGLIEEVGSGQPRIDYKDDSKGALKLEPSRSNSITYSEDLSNSSGWINQLGSTVIGNQSGVGNSSSAWKLNKASGTFKSLRFQSTLSSNNYTLSWYLKKGSLDVVEFRFDGGASAQFIDFNLRTGVAGTNNALTNIKMELINNEWYRCQASYNSTLTNVHLYLGDASSATQEGYIYAQSPQLEAGSYATSYIPTSGSAVTRLAESCSQTPPDGVIGQTEGTMYAEFKSLDNVSNLILWMRNPSGGSYGDMIKLECGGDNRMRFEVRESNATSCNLMSDVLPTNIYYKVAVAYKQNDFVLYLNGVQISVDTSGNVPTCSEMYVGKYIDAGIRMGVVKSLNMYNTRLSNSELAALTQV